MLRPYQQKLKSDIYQSWGNGARHTLAVLPTGGGKSVVVQDIAKDVDNAGEVQAIIAHRNELVAQMSGHIARAGIMHRLIAPQKAITQITRQHREEFGRSFVSPNARAAVVGVDTLRARASDLKDWARFHQDQGLFSCVSRDGQASKNAAYRATRDAGRWKHGQ